MPEQQEFESELELELEPGATCPGGEIVRRRVVSSLPPWRPRDEARTPETPPSPTPNLASANPPDWRERVIECLYVAGAMLCFGVAIVALARIHFLLEQDLLSLLGFAGLLALAAGAALLGSRVVQAMHARARGEAAPRLTSSPQPRSGSDPSPRPPPRDSRC